MARRLNSPVPSWKLVAGERRANHGLVVQTISSAQARQEIGDAVVLVVERAAVAILSREFDLPRVLVEVGHAVVHFVDGGEDLPAKSEVQGQLAADAPIVLREGADGVVALPHRAGEAQAIAHVRRQAQEEVGFRVSGVGSIEADLSGRAITAGGGHVVIAVANGLEAEAEGVRIVRPDGGIGILYGRLVEDLRRISLCRRRKVRSRRRPLWNWRTRGRAGIAWAGRGSGWRQPWWKATACWLQRGSSSCPRGNHSPASGSASCV